ncbi:uncharacterized protein LOC108415432 isoform X2 [Pygocentrus nattereri]|uniref:uncharacterized protein LOC108415432 isoform X2 n=1 Tax=Pygocentrus nattereri TaxID=42514 RepID=UPI001890EFAB|nr:uncharacterized protein LOC108415432 isoform X2 [Pygocentrus nattereri]
MSARLLICLIVCVGESTGSGGPVTAIAPGDDFSLSCPSSTGQDRWEGPQSDNTMRVNLNKTEYFLIKDFKAQNEGQYVCLNEKIKLEMKAATNDESVLFRASEGDSLFLFCKDLISSSLNATWSWRPHSSDQNSTLQPDSAGERLHFRNKDNDFSLTISKVDWGDSGRYECQRFSSSSQYKTFFEVVVVRARADPQQLTEGDDVTLQCEISHHLPNTRLYWINMQTQENFPNPHQLRNVTLGQRNWVCAVFIGSKLKALFPLTLNIYQHLTTTRSTPATHYENMGPGLFQKHFTLISVCSVFSFLLLVLIGAVYWRKKTKEMMQSSSVNDNITYAAVNFRQKSERMQSSSVNDNITYAAVNFRQKSETPAVPFPEFSSNSVSKCKNSGHVEEKEVIYSSVKLG